MKISIQFDGYEVEAELFETATARAIYEHLPHHENVNRWGDEIYFGIPVKAGLEDQAKAEVQVGDLAYWPNMPAFCIFFGPTPVSPDETPRAASPVNLIGKLSVVEPEALRRIPDGGTVRLEKAG